MGVSIALAVLCLGLGAMLLQDGRPGSRLGGVGLWVMAAGPTFGALDAAGIAPGAGPGTMNFALMAGWPLLGLGWALSRLEPGLADRIRPFIFVVLLIAAMLEPSGAGWARGIAAGALGVQTAIALRVWRPAPTTLGVLGALVQVMVLFEAEVPDWGPFAVGFGLILSAFGLRLAPSRFTLPA